MGNKNKIMKILMESMMKSHHCRFLSIIKRINKNMDKMMGSPAITTPIRSVGCSVPDREDKTVMKKVPKD